MNLAKTYIPVHKAHVCGVLFKLVLENLSEVIIMMIDHECLRSIMIEYDNSRFYF